MSSQALPSERIDSIDKLVNPIPVQRFLRELFGKQPVHVPGIAGRFHHLMTWDELNDILAERSSNFLDIRLMKEGALIPKEKYTQEAESEFLGRYSQLSVKKLTQYMREGATLVVNRLRELHAPVRELSDILEREFSSYVEVALFAGWHGTQGLPMHWDPEETFILQLVGAKRWRIWRPTRPCPIVRDRPEDVGQAGELYWEDDLKAGDLLHIPRGWWHEATPHGDPTLHITFAVRPPTGLDLASAVLRKSAVLRQNLPQCATDAEEADYLSSFRSAIVAALEEVSLSQFFTQIDSRAPSLARLSLPWSAVPDCALPDTARLHWQPRRGLVLEESGDTITLRALNATHTFSKVARGVLVDLMKAQSSTVQEICSRHPDADVRPFVGKLIASGLLAIHDHASTGPSTL